MFLGVEGVVDAVEKTADGDLGQVAGGFGFVEVAAGGKTGFIGQLLEVALGQFKFCNSVTLYEETAPE